MGEAKEGPVAAEVQKFLNYGESALRTVSSAHSQH
jgi:hypothetical protein